LYVKVTDPTNDPPFGGTYLNDPFAQMAGEGPDVPHVSVPAGAPLMSTGPLTSTALRPM
jgi:hypothetical protein